MNLQYSGNPFVTLSVPQARQVITKPIKKKVEREFLNEQEAADFFGVAKGTLANWRCTKTVEVPYVKIGAKVRYLKSDLDKWLNKQRVTPEGWGDE